MFYSYKLRDQIFVKRYRFLSFDGNINKFNNKCENILHISSQNLLDHAKKSTKYSLKTAFKRVIQKAAEANGHLISNKTANKTTKNSPQNIYIYPGIIMYTNIQKGHNKLLYININSFIKETNFNFSLSACHTLKVVFCQPYKSTNKFLMMILLKSNFNNDVFLDGAIYI